MPPDLVHQRTPISGLARWLRVSAVLVGIGIPAFFVHTLLALRAHELADAEEQVTKTVLALTQHAARTIEVAEGRLQSVAAFIAEHPGALDPEALHAALQRQLSNAQGIGNIFVTDRDGVMLAEAGAFPARHLDVQDRTYFKTLRDQPGEGLIVGDPIIGRLSGRPVLPIARRINGPDGTFAGIAQTSVDVEAFQDVYDAIENGAGGVLTLWRTDGTLLVRSPHVPDLVGRAFPSDRDYGAWVVPGETRAKWTEDRADGGEQVVALGFVNGRPLYVGAALRKTEVLVPWRPLAIPQGLLGGGLILIVISTLLLLARETERRQASDARIRLLAENATDVLIVGDLDLRPAYVSPAARTVLGWEPDEMVRTPLADLVHPDDIAGVFEHSSRVLAGGDAGICSARHRHKDGHYVWLEASARLVIDPTDGRKTGFVAALRDVTARRAAEDQIRHMALHDPLTGLPNRTLLHDRLAHAVAFADRTRSRFAVLACDLDRFKAVNDSLGHPAGDALLCVVAQRMQAVLHPYDTIARLGGDEFAVLVPHLDTPGMAADVAERLIAAVGEPVDLNGRVVEVGLSIGLVVAAACDGDADELFKCADMALYEAKAAGRSTHRAFSSAIGARAAARGQLGLDMKDAMRRGDFRLVYQPVVEARTGAVVSQEALMRWRHPTRGEVSPGEFIPVAEETGLIVPLGEWALHEACREAAGWAGDVHVAVNVSPAQFRHPGLEETVLAALAASGLPPRRLELEITESVLMDSDAASASLHRLRALGVRVALDDFGTGYSSLGYLHRFPFDKIKIDRSFIRDFSDPDVAAIVRAVVGIGERLGMGIVAEGVETVEQLDYVRREGCTQVQGFLFSRPLPPEEARLHASLSRTEAA